MLAGSCWTRFEGSDSLPTGSVKSSEEGFCETPDVIALSGTGSPREGRESAASIADSLIHANRRIAASIQTNCEYRERTDKQPGSVPSHRQPDERSLAHVAPRSDWNVHRENIWQRQRRSAFQCKDRRPRCLNGLLTLRFISIRISFWASWRDPPARSTESLLRPTNEAPHGGRSRAIEAQAVVMHPGRCHAESVPGAEFDGKCGQRGRGGNRPSHLFSIIYEWNGEDAGGSGGERGIRTPGTAFDRTTV